MHTPTHHIARLFVHSLEQVPETGRWRFMDISPKYETMVRCWRACRAYSPLTGWLQLAEASHQQLLQEFKGKVLPPNHPLTRHIRRVTTRILEASNLGTLEAPDVEIGRAHV